MREIVRDAFLAVRCERSPDAVVADPDLNEPFLLECRTRGLSDLPAVLNQCLLNMRKGNDLKGLKSKRVPLRDQENYRFASEIAARFLERRDQISLDQILCDPGMAAEFDKIAAELAPGYSPFQYRFAALGLRKRRELRPELLGRIVVAEVVVNLRATDVNIDELPIRAGLYLFIEPTSVLYVGECTSLRKRLGRHLDHSDNKGLARWLWERGTTDLHIEYHVLPMGTPGRVRKAMEAELIRSRKPFFNLAGIER
jgi:site-specific DNA-methyltransferase (adenine-specific)